MNPWKKGGRGGDFNFRRGRWRGGRGVEIAPSLLFLLLFPFLSFFLFCHFMCAMGKAAVKGSQGVQIEKCGGNFIRGPAHIWTLPYWRKGKRENRCSPKRGQEIFSKCKFEISSNSKVGIFFLFFLGNCVRNE